MAVERIKNDVLAESRDLDNKFADKEVLYGIDLNEITRLFRAGVNANYTDIVKIITGSNSDAVIYQDDSELPLIATDGDIAYVFSYTTVEGDIEDGIFLYKYLSGSWTQIHRLSLNSVNEKAIEAEQKASNANKKIFLSSQELEGIDTDEIPNGALLFD